MFARLGRTLVLSKPQSRNRLQGKLHHSLAMLRPPFWVPEKDGDQYQERLSRWPQNTAGQRFQDVSSEMPGWKRTLWAVWELVRSKSAASLESLASLASSALVALAAFRDLQRACCWLRFESYNAWISYADFRKRMNASIPTLYMSPREAKNRHSPYLSICSETTVFYQCMVYIQAGSVSHLVQLLQEVCQLSKSCFEVATSEALNVPLGRYSHLRVWWRSLMMNGDTARFDATTLRLFVREINLIIKI